MKPYWVDKIDPEHYPVRFIANLWQKRMYGNFRVPAQISPKEYGQFRDLRRFLGEWTQFVVEWMTEPKHWNHFTAMVQMEVPKIQIPLEPHIGFLVKQRTRALKIMREYLRDSTSPADMAFVEAQDQLRYQQFKEKAVAFSGGKPEVLAKIAMAKTLVEMQMVFNEILGGN
jgi:hypothetical protein